MLVPVKTEDSMGRLECFIGIRHSLGKGTRANGVPSCSNAPVSDPGLVSGFCTEHSSTSIPFYFIFDLAEYTPTRSTQ